VIQNDLLNRSNIQTTVVALLTSNKRLSKVPGNVLLRRGTANLPKTSVAVVSQIATVGKGRLLEKMGTLPRDKLEEIISGCQMVICPSFL
jgi:mRNA interferase MazF